MSQPVWKCVLVTDTWALYVDTTDVYPPELEVMEEDEDQDEDTATVEVYRFALERKAICCAEDDCTRTHLVPYGFPERTDLPYPIHTYKEWFSDKIRSVASSASRTSADLRAAFCSADMHERMHAYLDLGGHHGFRNLDAYPVTMPRAEFEDRWQLSPDTSTSEEE